MFNLALAMIGMVSLVIGLGAEIRMRVGANVFNAIGSEGAASLVFAAFVLYGFRLIFWDHVPTRYQNLTRNLLISVLCAELALAAVTVFLVVTQGNVRPQPGGTFVAISFTGWGVLFQISTVLWLLRYRRQ